MTFVQRAVVGMLLAASGPAAGRAQTPPRDRTIATLEDLMELAWQF